MAIKAEDYLRSAICLNRLLLMCTIIGVPGGASEEPNSRF